MRRLRPGHWAITAVAMLTLSALGSYAIDPLGSEAPSSDPVAASADAEAAASASGSPLGASIGPRGLDAAAPPEIGQDPPFPLEEGKVPTKTEALDFDKRFSRFIAVGDEGLDKLRRDGHLTGSGTPDDPYVLERFYVDGTLKIQSTDRALILRDGYVNGQLALNYVGAALYVHHLYAKDLRINENVEREGPITGGLFHDNQFGFVGQIRHFIGTFRDNTVGPVPQGVVREYLSDTGTARVDAGVVFNFDGFHGAVVRDNIFRGAVDIKLHGHHHGDCLTCPPHDHADPDELAHDHKVAASRTARHQHDNEETAAAGADGPDHDHDHDRDQAHAAPEPSMADLLGFRTRHSIRHHSLLFEDNTIEVAPESRYALRYNDRDHDGDDVTANSEPSIYLEDPHVHYQDVTFRGNELRGGAFVLEIFNAKSDRHVTQNQGVLRLDDNQVVRIYEETRGDQVPHVGFDLQKADGIALRVIDNDVRFEEKEDDLPLQIRSPAKRAPYMYGFQLSGFHAGDLLFSGNTVATGDIGVIAWSFDPQVSWVLEDNRFETEESWRANDAPPPEGDAT